MIRSSRAFVLPLAACLASLAVSAWAGVTDPNHRVERVGGTQAAQPVATLPYPGVGRAVVALRNGEIRLVAGDGLVNELLIQLNVAQACAGEGLLNAAWNPAAPGTELYVTYITNATPRRLALAKIVVDANRKAGTPEVLYQTGASASCMNLGGGIAFTADGKVLVGVGDQGVRNDAQLPSSTKGKILRLNLNGTPAAGNLLPGSAVYNFGVRNPVSFTVDPLGDTWFVDAGDVTSGDADELNFVSTDPSNANFGWPDGTGMLGRSDRIDPPASWSPAVGATSVVSYRHEHLGASWAGDLVVTTSTGQLWRVNTDDGSVLFPTKATAYTQDALGMPFRASFVGADGFVYLAVAGGDVWRFRSSRGIPIEPSAATSIAPMTMRKVAGGTADDPMVEVTIEKQPDAIMYGPYRGDLSALDPAADGDGDTVPDGMNHPTLAGAGDYFCVTTPSRPEDAALCASGVTVTNDPVDAYIHFRVASSFFEVTPCTPTSCAHYALASARSPAVESTIGTNSFNETTYGGNIEFGCPCPTSSVPGTKINQCVDSSDGSSTAPFTLAWGREGPGNTIGPVTFDDSYDCKVVLIDLSEFWCGPCHSLADDLEPLYLDYKDLGFTLLTVISEDDNGGFNSNPDINAATQATIDQWIAIHGSTNPVLLDERKRVMFQYMDSSAGHPCGGQQGYVSWPRSMLFDPDGVQVQVFCGYDPDGIRAGVERELREAGFIP